MKSRIETAKRQTDQSKALRVAESRAARTARAAATLAERERSVAQKRAAAAQRLTEKAQLRQQAQERKAKAVRQKIEAEQALEASIEKQKRIEQVAAQNRKDRAAASATLRQMRKSRYIQTVVKLVQPVRNAPALLLVLALTLGVGGVALVSNSLSPESSGQLASTRSLGTGASGSTNTFALKMDNDLSASSVQSAGDSPSR